MYQNDDINIIKDTILKEINPYQILLFGSYATGKQTEESDIDLMILCLGANDMLRGINPKETKSNLEEIIKIAKDKNIKVIIAGMIAPTSYGLNYKKTFDKIFSDLAKIYDYKLNNDEKAREYYQQLILNYQGSIFVSEARERFRILRGDNLINN